MFKISGPARTPRDRRRRDAIKSSALSHDQVRSAIMTSSICPDAEASIETHCRIPSSCDKHAMNMRSMSSSADRYDPFTTAGVNSDFVQCKFTKDTKSVKEIQSLPSGHREAVSPCTFSAWFIGKIFYNAWPPSCQ